MVRGLARSLAGWRSGGLWRDLGTGAASCGSLADPICDGADAGGQGVGVHPQQHLGAVAEDVGDGPEIAEIGGAAHHVGGRGVAESMRADRKSTRMNFSHYSASRMPPSAANK